MPEDFYFAYGYDGKSATRLYRFINGNFERFNPDTKVWEPDPGQSRIFVGEDLDYEEITEEQANKITVLV